MPRALVLWLLYKPVTLLLWELSVHFQSHLHFLTGAAFLRAPPHGLTDPFPWTCVTAATLGPEGVVEMRLSWTKAACNAPDPCPGAALWGAASMLSLFHLQCLAHSWTQVAGTVGQPWPKKAVSQAATPSCPHGLWHNDSLHWGNSLRDAHGSLLAMLSHFQFHEERCFEVQCYCQSHRCRIVSSFWVTTCKCCLLFFEVMGSFIGHWIPTSVETYNEKRKFRVLNYYDKQNIS